ncbi:MAG: hypothetical protein JXC36_05840 [Candidatus Atribacteria bacterium]|nr:hypothetical protein [Candidatus Atribacteria bacterium]
MHRNKNKERLEGILSIACILLSVFSGYIIWQKWGLFAGIAGAVICFVIISVIIQTIPKAVFHIALFEDENNKVKKEEVKKKGIVKPDIEKLKEKEEVKGVKFIEIKYREDDMFGIPTKYTYEIYNAKNKKQALEFLNNKSVD